MLENMRSHIGASLLGLLLCLGCIETGFLWFEQIPDANNPCVITVMNSEPMSWKDIHPDPTCTKGGLIWYALWGGVHLHFFQDLQKQEEFKLCLTGGEANTVGIHYDYMGKYWSPVVFPNFQYEPTERDMCRRSLNGTLDLYLRGIRKEFQYFTFVTWEIEPSEQGQEPFEKKHKEDIKKRQELKAKEKREREEKAKQEKENQ